MKLSIITLLIFLLCSSFEYKNNKNIRKLDIGETGDIYSDTVDTGDIVSDTEYISDIDYSSEPLNTDSNNKNQPIITPSPQFILLGFGDFQSEDNLISFIVFCKRIFTNVYPRILFITVRIDFGRLRNLEEFQTIKCTLKENQNDIDNDNFNYDCQLEKKIDNIKQISIDKNQNFELYESDEEGKSTKINNVVINPTPNAIKTMDNIQNEKGTKTFFVLQNSTKIQEENKFKISGKIDTPDEDLHNSTFNLNVYENGKIIQIPCTLYSKKNNGKNNYELECTPQYSIYASLNNSDGNIKEDKYLVVSMMDENDYIYYNFPNNNYRSKKSSSRGLSGGTIAAIVISCVVAVVAIAIIAVLFNKPKSVSHSQTQSQSLPDNQKSSLKMYESDISNNQ